MKDLYIFIFIFTIFLSLMCCKSYQFEKIDGINIIKYSTGSTEGVVLQKKQWREPSGRQFGKIIFTDQTMKGLERYLRECDDFINAWFREDTTNNIVRDWFKTEKYSLSDDHERKNYLTWLGMIFTEKSKKHHFSKLQEEIEYFRNVGKTNINKLKRTYVLELSDKDNGWIEVYVFLLEDDPRWYYIYPPNHLAIDSVSFILFFKLKDGVLSIEHIYYD